MNGTRKSHPQLPIYKGKKGNSEFRNLIKEKSAAMDPLDYLEKEGDRIKEMVPEVFSTNIIIVPNSLSNTFCDVDINKLLEEVDVKNGKV